MSDNQCHAGINTTSLTKDRASLKGSEVINPPKTQFNNLELKLELMSFVSKTDTSERKPLGS